MLNRIVAVLVSLVLLVCTSSADAALMAYMKIKGQKSGDVKGSVTQKGRENMIGVIGTTHEVDSPRDAATGMASGKRQHRPFVVTKEVDKSSPVLYSMLISNETLPEVTIQFWRAGPNGAEVQFYTVKLTNAAISSIKFAQPSTVKPETQRLSETEEVSFTYQKIQWTWTDGGITAGDDWQIKI